VATIGCPARCRRRLRRQCWVGGRGGCGVANGGEKEGESGNGEEDGDKDQVRYDE
jgi:hypothetical protein